MNNLFYNWLFYKTPFYNNITETKMAQLLAKIIDFIWTLIPILMIILITIPTFAILFELDKLHKILIKLVAIGNQWFWT